jgi:uncharacterized protein
MLDLNAYLELRNAPLQMHVMHQLWRDLLFLHFAEEPAAVQRLLPPGLQVDTYPDAGGRERAWIGLVPFRMEGIRATGAPALPGLSAFPETNVRTYVHRDGAEPGVWFFSLDAANRTACRFARRFFRLPYWHAEMEVVRSSDRIRYRSCRLEGSPGTATLEVEAEIGQRLDAPEPGTLEFFLVERYLLYAAHAGRLATGRVWHEPYRLRRATLSRIEETMVEAAGLSPRVAEHVLFSEGVDVRVFPLRRMDG